SREGLVAGLGREVAWLGPGRTCGLGARVRRTRSPPPSSPCGRTASPRALGWTPRAGSGDGPPLAIAKVGNLAGPNSPLLRHLSRGAALAFFALHIVAGLRTGDL